MNVEAQKNLSMVLVLIVILGLVGIPSSPICSGHDEVCCMGHEMRIPQHSAEPKKVPHAESYCCGAKAVPCNAFEDCASALPDLVFFVVPTMKNPTSANMASITADLLHAFDSLGGLSNSVFSSGMVSSVPLFLLNVSLLC
jgi:hypothetical protein